MSFQIRAKRVPPMLTSTKKIQVGCLLVCTFAVIVMGILRNWQESKLLTPRISIPHRTDPPKYTYTHPHRHPPELQDSTSESSHRDLWRGNGEGEGEGKDSCFLHAAYVRKSHYAERFQHHTQPPYRATLMADHYVWRLTECTKSPAPSTLTHVASVVHIDRKN